MNEGQERNLKDMTKRWIVAPLSIVALVILLVIRAEAQAQGAPAGAGRSGQQDTVTGPWSDAARSPDERAELLLKEMTLDEKVTLVHGAGRPFGSQQPSSPTPAGPAVSNGGAGFTQSVPRLGIPAIQMADASVGVTRGAAAGRYSTLLPDTVSAASSWDMSLACEYGSLIGQELRDQGYTMSLGGGVNIAREPRNGRLFEYAGEDPIL